MRLSTTYHLKIILPRKGEVCRAEKRRWECRRVQEKETKTAEDSLHQPAAAGAGSHFPEEPIPGHEHPRGDRSVDQPHGGPGPGTTIIKTLMQSETFA